MSVGLLIITHAPFGTAALQATFGTLGSVPLPTRVMDIQPDCDPEQERDHARIQLRELDQGDGVLILTDLYGSTPSNIASSLVDEAPHRVLVSGLSLSMLIRVMNYTNDDLQSLAEKAVSGGHCGIYQHPPLAKQEKLDHD